MHISVNDIFDFCTTTIVRVFICAGGRTKFTEKFCVLLEIYAQVCGNVLILPQNHYEFSV